MAISPRTSTKRSFCNASYFTNTFRRETGLTPKACRKRKDRS